jgi:hypothetical protein
MTTASELLSSVQMYQSGLACFHNGNYGQGCKNSEKSFATKLQLLASAIIGSNWIVHGLMGLPGDALKPFQFALSLPVCVPVETGCINVFQCYLAYRCCREGYPLERTFQVYFRVRYLDQHAGIMNPVCRYDYFFPDHALHIRHTTSFGEITNTN